MTSTTEIALKNLEKAQEAKKVIRERDKERVRIYIREHGNRRASIISEYLHIPARAVNRYKKELGIPTLYNASQDAKAHFKQVYQSRVADIRDMQKKHRAASKVLTLKWDKDSEEKIQEFLI